MGLLQSTAGSGPLLVCVGGPASAEGAYRDFAARRGIAQGDIRFIGEVRNVEVPNWIRAFDVAAIPFPAFHHFETVSPIKLVEYLASGACVLATDLASIREEVEHGVTAWLTPADAAGIAQGIDRLLSDDALRHRLGAAAAAAVVNRTWHSRGVEILNFIESGRQRGRECNVASATDESVGGRPANSGAGSSFN
jgi:glycosyltransferase involved in cell wall biosynthesis